MTKLAAEFRLSDVALHKICRKHNIPTPYLGYWAKKAHDKPVTNTPLPEQDGSSEIVVHQGAASDESEAMAAARGEIRSVLEERQQDQGGAVRNPIFERTLAKLAKAKPDRTGIAKVEGKGLIKVAVRPESVERATQVLEALVSGAEAAGILLKVGDGSAVWFVENETVSFELVEAADKIEHVPTEAELKAVAKWEAQREADQRRYGYLRDWGRPKIPKWEERYQGRLAVHLEEVKILSLDRYWATAIRRVFADSKTQDVIKMIPKILSTIAAMAVAKRENREVEERRRLAEEEVARRRADAERRAAIEKRRVAALKQLMVEGVELERLRRFVETLERSGDPAPETRMAALLNWARQRLAEEKPTSAMRSLRSDSAMLNFLARTTRKTSGGPSHKCHYRTRVVQRPSDINTEQRLTGHPFSAHRPRLRLFRQADCRCQNLLSMSALFCRQRLSFSALW